MPQNLRVTLKQSVPLFAKLQLHYALYKQFTRQSLIKAVVHKPGNDTCSNHGGEMCNSLLKAVLPNILQKGNKQFFSCFRLKHIYMKYTSVAVRPQPAQWKETVRAVCMSHNKSPCSFQWCSVTCKTPDWSFTDDLMSILLYCTFVNWQEEWGKQTAFNHSSYLSVTMALFSPTPTPPPPPSYFLLHV